MYYSWFVSKVYISKTRSRSKSIRNDLDLLENDNYRHSILKAYYRMCLKTKYIVMFYISTCLLILKTVCIQLKQYIIFFLFYITIFSKNDINPLYCLYIYSIVLKCTFRIYVHVLFSSELENICICLFELMLGNLRWCHCCFSVRVAKLTLPTNWRFLYRFTKIPKTNKDSR